MVDGNDSLFMNEFFNFTNAMITLKVEVCPRDILTQPSLFVRSRNDPYIVILLQVCIQCLFVVIV